MIPLRGFIKDFVVIEISISLFFIMFFRFMRCEDVCITHQLLHLLLHFMGVKNCNRVAKHGIFASDRSLKAYHTFLCNMIINIQFSYMYQWIWHPRDRLAIENYINTLERGRKRQGYLVKS